MPTRALEQQAYIRLSKESNPGLRDYDESVGDSLCWAQAVIQGEETRILVDGVDVTNRATVICWHGAYNTVAADSTGYGRVGVMEIWP